MQPKTFWIERWDARSMDWYAIRVGLFTESCTYGVAKSAFDELTDKGRYRIVYGWLVDHGVIEEKEVA